MQTITFLLVMQVSHFKKLQVQQSALLSFITPFKTAHTVLHLYLRLTRGRRISSCFRHHHPCHITTSFARSQSTTITSNQRKHHLSSERLFFGCLSTFRECLKDKKKPLLFTTTSIMHSFALNHQQISLISFSQCSIKSESSA